MIPGGVVAFFPVDVLVFEEFEEFENLENWTQSQYVSGGGVTTDASFGVSGGNLVVASHGNNPSGWHGPRADWNAAIPENFRITLGNVSCSSDAAKLLQVKIAIGDNAYWYYGDNWQNSTGDLLVGHRLYVNGDPVTSLVNSYSFAGEIKFEKVPGYFRFYIDGIMEYETTSTINSMDVLYLISAAYATYSQSTNFTVGSVLLEAL